MSHTTQYLSKKHRREPRTLPSLWLNRYFRFCKHLRKGLQPCPVSVQTAAGKLDAEARRTEEDRGWESWDGPKNLAGSPDHLSFLCEPVFSSALSREAICFKFPARGNGRSETLSSPFPSRTLAEFRKDLFSQIAKPSRQFKLVIRAAVRKEKNISHKERKGAERRRQAHLDLWLSPFIAVHHWPKLFAVSSVSKKNGSSRNSGRTFDVCGLESGSNRQVPLARILGQKSSTRRRGGEQRLAEGRQNDRTCRIFRLIPAFFSAILLSSPRLRVELYVSPAHGRWRGEFRNFHRTTTCHSKGFPANS